MDNKFKNLIDWINNNNGFINNSLTIKDNNSNRSVFSTCTLKKEDLLVKIPSTLIFNYTFFENKPDLEYKSIIETEKKDNTLLNIILLIKEKYKQENSFFYPYINILPLDFSYHPLYYFLNNDASYLEYANYKLYITFIIQKNYILLITKYITCNYKEIKKDDIIWAYFIFLTRSWSHNGLVPYIDMFQHSNLSSMLLNNKKVEYTLSLCENINENSEIFDSYNVFDDEALYSTFGFLSKDTLQFSSCPIKELNMKFENNNFDLIKKTLIENNISNKLYLSNKDLTNLMELLRIYFLSTNELKYIDINTKFYKNQISLENELTCYKFLIKNFQHILLLNQCTLDNNNLDKLYYFNFVELNKRKNNIYKYQIDKLVDYVNKMLL